MSAIARTATDQTYKHRLAYQSPSSQTHKHRLDSITIQSNLDSHECRYAFIKKSLSDLPNEILCEIISHLVREKPSLCQLARTSHHLNSLVRPFMTRDIDFTVFHARSYARRYQDFTHIIHWNPIIAQSVRTVTIAASDLESTSYLSACLLEGLPKLRTLKVVTDPSDPSDPSDHPSDRAFTKFFINHPLPSLQNIILDGPLVEEGTFIKLMSFQGLENITITSNTINVDEELMPNCHIPTSPVLSLDIGENSLDGFFMLKLLNSFRALRRLRCSVPWHESLEEAEEALEAAPPLEYFLGRTRHSLTELVLVRTHGPKFAHDLPRMDLNTFGVLRVLEVASCCLKARRPCKGRSGVYRLLPRSLQELRIVFSSKEDIMDDDVDESVVELSEDAHVKGENDCVHGRYHEKYASKYEWLKELADQKAEYLPELGLVVLKGVELGYQYRHTLLVDLLDRPARWFIPQKVVEAFEGAGVDVDVEVKEWRSLISTFAKTIRGEVRPQQSQSWLDYRCLSIKALIHGAGQD